MWALSGASPKLKWTASVVEWVELIYALYTAGVISIAGTTAGISGTKLSLKQLFRAMGEVFDFEVAGFSRAFIDIKNRVKGDRTKFLDELKRGLRHRMDESDNKSH